MRGSKLQGLMYKLYLEKPFFKILNRPGAFINFPKKNAVSHNNY